MNKKTILTLILIVLIAFSLRFFKITDIPPSLNWDEVSIGYNAYSILQTGKDEWGVFLPIHFKAFGEYKLPIQIYASVPGIYFLGLNELGVRITPVVYGTLTVLFMFFLGRAIFQKNSVGLLSAFFLAISPWHIHLTRASFESSFAVFWIVLGVWFLIKGFKDSRWLVLSMIPFAVSIYTYNSARVFTPLLLFTLFLIYRRTWLGMKKAVILTCCVFAALMLPLFPYFFSGERDARFKLVSITDDPGLNPRINENRGNTQLPEPLPRIIHNKATYVSFYFVSNYLAHFNPDFLFISGASHKQHHVQGIGELYLFQAPLLLIGLYFLIKRKNKFRWLLFSWITLAFVPVSITNDSIPHALRTLIAVPVYQFISAFGAYYLYLWLKDKNLGWKITGIASAVIILGISLSLYLNNYYNIYSRLYSKDWQYGYKQVVEYIKEHQSEYDEIVFSRHFGEPHIFTLFYLKFNPAAYQQDSHLVRFESSDWVWVLNFNKYYFPDLGDKGTTFFDITKKNPNKKMLFIGKKGDFPDNQPKLAIVNFLNGDEAFEIVEVK